MKELLCLVWVITILIFAQTAIIGIQTLLLLWIKWDQHRALNTKVKSING